MSVIYFWVYSFARNVFNFILIYLALYIQVKSLNLMSIYRVLRNRTTIDDY